MRLILRLPYWKWTTPFLGLYCHKWGRQYSKLGLGFRTVYRAGVGIGTVNPYTIYVHFRNVSWAPEGHWKWWYWDGRWHYKK